MRAGTQEAKLAPVHSNRLAFDDGFGWRRLGPGHTRDQHVYPRPAGAWLVSTVLFLVGPSLVASVAALALIPRFLLRRGALIEAAPPDQLGTTVIPAQAAPYVLGGFIVTLAAVVLWIVVQALTPGP